MSYQSRRAHRTEARRGPDPLHPYRRHPANHHRRGIVRRRQRAPSPTTSGPLPHAMVAPEYTDLAGLPPWPPDEPGQRHRNPAPPAGTRRRLGCQTYTSRSHHPLPDAAHPKPAVTERSVEKAAAAGAAPPPAADTTGIDALPVKAPGRRPPRTAGRDDTGGRWPVVRDRMPHTRSPAQAAHRSLR